MASCGVLFTQSMCNSNQNCLWQGAWCADSSNCGALYTQDLCKTSTKCAWQGAFCANIGIFGGSMGGSNPSGSTNPNPATKTSAALKGEGLFSFFFSE
jgi:hypothetical protein